MCACHQPMHTVVGRSCMDRLMEAASTLLGQAGGAAEWADYAGPAPAVLTAEYQRAAQRATRCLAVMQMLVEDCQVRHFPLQPHAYPHAGSSSPGPAVPFCDCSMVESVSRLMCRAPACPGDLHMRLRSRASQRRWTSTCRCAGTAAGWCMLTADSVEGAVLRLCAGGCAGREAGAERARARGCARQQLRGRAAAQGCRQNGHACLASPPAVQR